MTLVKFNGDKTAKALIPGFNDVFESVFNDSFFSDRLVSRVPAVNISESADHFHIELAAPGLKKSDFKISVDENRLIVSVEQQQQGQATDDLKFTRKEFSFMSFVRSFAIPDIADQGRIEASYEDGILRVNLAKKEEAKSISRQIELK